MDEPCNRAEWGVDLIAVWLGSNIHLVELCNLTDVFLHAHFDISLGFTHIKTIAIRHVT